MSNLSASKINSDPANLSKNKTLVCDLDQHLKSKLAEIKTNVSHSVQHTIDQLKSKPGELARYATQTVTQPVHKISNQIKQSYLQTSIGRWRAARPDITLLIEVIILVGLGVALYLIWPYLTASKSPIFSKAQYLKAMSLPETSFSIFELGKIKIEMEALRNYFDYYQSNPFSPDNQGLNDIAKGNIFLPIFSFLAIYILPPFVILYILWFIIKYFTYVWQGFWGWVEMMKDYSTTKLQNYLGSKWYLRALFGHPRAPVFSEYFNNWRRRYVDIPVAKERIKYVQQYYDAKRRYYTLPKRYYYDLPRDQFGIKLEYYRKLYIDRALNVFMNKVIEWYHIYYEGPRDELYRYLLRNHTAMAEIWVKLMASQKQIRGLPYEKVTPNGQTCTCPPKPTKTSTTLGVISDYGQKVKSGLLVAGTKAKSVYDKVHPVPAVTAVKALSQIPNQACQVVDHALSTGLQNRWGIGQIIVGGIFVTLISFVAYTYFVSTPLWVTRWISPTWRYKMINLSPVLQGRYGDYSLILMVAIILAVLGYILYYLNRNKPNQS